MDEPGLLGDREVAEPGGVMLRVFTHGPPVPVLQANASLSSRARIAETVLARREVNEAPERFARPALPADCALNQPAGTERADRPAQ